MTRIRTRHVSIGAVYDSPDLDLLREVFERLDIQWGAEGSRVAGYDISVSRDDASGVIEILRELVEANEAKLRMFFYEKPRGLGKALTDADFKLWEAWRTKCYNEADES